MNSHVRNVGTCMILLVPFALIACDRGGGIDDSSAPESGTPSAEASGDSNRIAIPPSVRANLGISFVTVERRQIEQTLRAPGRFEYLPTARREYRTPLPGRVELLVQQFDRVEAGVALYRIDSRLWREMQQEVVEAEASLRRLEAKRTTFEPLWAAHERHETSLHETVRVWEERVEQLQSLREAGGGRINEMAEARSSLATTRAELANVQEKKAMLEADRAQTIAEIDAASARRNFLLDSAAAIVGVPHESLIEVVRTDHGEEPRWMTINTIEVHATESGVVESLGLTNGSWADEKSTVVSIVQPDKLRFRASGLQSDLGAMKEGLPARIVPPTPTATGRAVRLQETMSGRLAIGLAGDPNDRTLELFVVPTELKSWARPGVTAQLEIVTDESAQSELAVPLAAVQRDGLHPVIFRRNPDNPNEAIRIEADLGMDDGRWVALLSGVRDGDEVVLDGAFQLMLATSGSIQKGGHFHPDGTFHEGEDE